jgi:hypothetical protein
MEEMGDEHKAGLREQVDLFKKKIEEEKVHIRDRERELRLMRAALKEYPLEADFVRMMAERFEAKKKAIEVFGQVMPDLEDVLSGEDE